MLFKKKTPVESDGALGTWLEFNTFMKKKKFH